MTLLPDDWLRIFALETPVLELIARGTALYFGILIFMRLMPRRTAGDLAVMDLIFLLLIVDAAAHAMGNYSAVADGLLMIATFMAWNYALNFLSYYVPFIERLVNSKKLLIVRDGRLLRRNMRREFLTEEELLDHLRRKSIDDIREVRAAYVEGDGKISVLVRKGRKEPA